MVTFPINDQRHVNQRCALQFNIEMLHSPTPWAPSITFICRMIRRLWLVKDIWRLSYYFHSSPRRNSKSWPIADQNKWIAGSNIYTLFISISLSCTVPTVDLLLRQLLATLWPAWWKWSPAYNCVYKHDLLLYLHYPRLNNMQPYHRYLDSTTAALAPLIPSSSHALITMSMVNWLHYKVRKA